MRQFVELQHANACGNARRAATLWETQVLPPSFVHVSTVGHRTFLADPLRVSTPLRTAMHSRLVGHATTPAKFGNCGGTDNRATVFQSVPPSRVAMIVPPLTATQANSFKQASERLTIPGPPASGTGVNTQFSPPLSDRQIGKESLFGGDRDMNPTAKHTLLVGHAIDVVPLLPKT